MQKLNTEQQTAVDCKDKHIVCLAGAGTGKTFTLIERMIRIASETGHPERILALTFTNAAAFEMKTRYRNRCESAITPEFRTFHSFAYSLLCNDLDVRKQVGYMYVPKIVDEGAKSRIETKVKLQLNVKLSSAKLANPSNLSYKEQFEYNTYKQAVRRELIKSNYITFDILIDCICSLFEQNDSSVQKYKDLYQYIFVDEFQDTDPKQWNFVQSFSNADIFVCGDALQAIYGFRGADSSIIKALAKSPDWTAIKLFENYRSTSEICKFANNMSDYADDEYRIEIESTKSGKPVKVKRYETVPYMKCVDTSCLDSIIRDSTNTDGTSAILCRTNREVDDVCSYLDKLNVPYDRNIQKNEAEQILKSITDNAYFADWISTYLSSENYAEYIRNCTINPDKLPIQILSSEYGRLPQISERMDYVIQIRRIIKDTTLTIDSRINSILDMLYIDSKYMEDTNTIQCANDLIAYCLGKLHSIEDSKLYVGTAHSVKGLEYNNVYVIGPGGFSWKLKDEQNKNLYYVAITRAKSRLFIYKGEVYDD